MRDIRGHYLETISEVDLSCFARNIGRLSKWVKGREIILAVKANAYGHGIVPICREASANGIKRFGVANLTEAVTLRDSGVKEEIILLTPPTMEQIPSIVHHSISPNVTSLMFAQTLSAQSMKANRKTKIHIEIDTGMGRAGFIYNDCLGDILSIAKLPGLVMEGIFTHFSSADGLSEDEKNFTMLQLERFSKLVEKAKALGLVFPVVHSANSAGCLYFPIYGNAVRPGLCVYGVQPNLLDEPPIELEPIITLKTQVVQLRELPKDWSISYGRTFTTGSPLRIAVIRAGYGDGLRRALSNNGEVLIGGKLRRIRGVICMDTAMVEVDNGVSLDDEVIIIGKQGDLSVTPADHARCAGTIPYEILTGISERVKRIYLREGLIVGES